MGNIGPIEILFPIIWIGIAWLIGHRAQEKGYSFWMFFIFGLLFWLITAVIVLFLPRREVSEAPGPAAT
jgi:hypothetical protein